MVLENHHAYKLHSPGLGKGMSRRAHHCTNIAPSTTCRSWWLLGPGTSLNAKPPLGLRSQFRVLRKWLLQGHQGWRRHAKESPTSVCPPVSYVSNPWYMRPQFHHKWRLSVVSGEIFQSLSIGNLGSSQSDVNVIALRRAIRDFRERNTKFNQTIV